MMSSSLSLLWQSTLTIDKNVHRRVHEGPRRSGSFCPIQTKQQLPLVIVKGNEPSLLGRHWLHHAKLNRSRINAVQVSNTSRSSVLDKFEDVFADVLGTIQSKLTMDDSACPKFCKPRPVPLAMRTAVEQELERLKSEGMLEKKKVDAYYDRSKGGQECADYKVTVKPALDIDQYPPPHSEYLFATLAGGHKLGSKTCYQQLILEK